MEKSEIFNLADKINSRNAVISVVGLGYVGLPLAIAFGHIYRVIGFDLNKQRIEELKQGEDRTREVDAQDLKSAEITFTDDFDHLRQADIHIIAVPTPVDEAKQPDLTSLIQASETVGRALKSGGIVVYESTVYPGVTEEVCAAVLERTSGLKCGIDFKLGYSPERINPGDKDHTFTKIKKVVSGQDEGSLDIIANLYQSVVPEGVHRAPSIKVAEAAKVIENTQRDLNIALMNELAILFDHLSINTRDVLDAASTKWNFLKFKPGLVGGHCIGVDPYYLTYRAEKAGYIPQVILAGRRINDGMGRFIAQRTVKEMIRAGHNIHKSTVTVLGLTFKEDVSDIRNSKVIDILRELQDYGIDIQVHDPLALCGDAIETYGITLTPLASLRPSDAVIVAVAHKLYRDLAPHQLRGMMRENPVLVDVKSIYDQESMTSAGLRLWQL